MEGVHGLDRTMVILELYHTVARAENRVHGHSRPFPLLVVWIWFAAAVSTTTTMVDDD